MTMTTTSSNSNDDNSSIMNESLPKRPIDPPGRKSNYVYKRSPNRQSRQSSNNNKKDSKYPKWKQGEDERRRSDLIVKYPFPGTDQTLRIPAHAVLLRLEARRRSETSLRFKAIKEQWDITQEILQKGLKDVAIAERLLISIAKAEKVFADNLQAVSLDKLVDVKRNVVKSPTRQSKLYKERKTVVDMKNSYLQPFHTIIDNSLRIMSEQATMFDEKSDRIMKYTLPELSQLKTKLQDRSTLIQNLGETLMKDIEFSEDLVLSTWGEYKK